jgi:hypothetical protein
VTLYPTNLEISSKIEQFWPAPECPGVAPFLVFTAGMTDPQKHRVSLLLALAGILLMLTASIARLGTDEIRLPNRDSLAHPAKANDYFMPRG